MIQLIALPDMNSIAVGDKDEGGYFRFNIQYYASQLVGSCVGKCGADLKFDIINVTMEQAIADYLPSARLQLLAIAQDIYPNTFN